ncbi:MAG: 4-alpha-glucanotransferase [Ferruginibacter sp.]
MTLNFYIRFSTRFGQALYLSGSHTELGNDDIAKAIPLQYFNENFWHVQVELPGADFTSLAIEYRYVLREKDGYEIVEWGNDRVIDFKKISAKDIILIDTWNHAGEVENAFFTQPFQGVLLNPPAVPKVKAIKSFTHELRVKAPLLKENEVIAVAGSGKALGEWNTDKLNLLTKDGNWWSVKLNLASENFPVAYKYCVYDISKKSLVKYESGSNRMIAGSGGKGKQTIIHDGFVQLSYPSWRGAGVAIPVFSLRTNKSFGTGEFTDIKLLVDWAKICGLKLIQLLPVNDTTATHTWTDSYPYAAISAFALHPLYLNLAQVAGTKNAAIVKALEEERMRLNAEDKVDYEAVTQLKFDTAKKLYEMQKEKFSNDTKYFEFFELNRHWLVPYAAFCYLRDKYKTSDYSQWTSHSLYDENAVQQLVDPSEEHYDEIAVYYFIQYHLHLQLKDATAYAHKNGIIVKGESADRHLSLWR